jgi:polysaccharide export outer membrane protein
MRTIWRATVNGIGLAAVLTATTAAAQVQTTAHAPATGAPATTPPVTAAASGVVVPTDYVIGVDDALSVVFWRDKDMSADVTVRPDGKISLPLLNEVQAAGYTPEQLRAKIVEAASKYVEEPNATVVIKEIKSRKVFITGNVAKPSSYPLAAEMNVLQLIAQAGGLLEYADSKNIVVMRKDGSNQQYFKVNYNDVLKQKNVAQNITLKPGDTVVVP